MDDVGSKIKIFLFVVIFLIIIGLLVAGVVFLFSSSTKNSTDNSVKYFTEQNIPITKYPIKTPIDYSMVK